MISHNSSYRLSYDVVYYWTGGTERGQWNEAQYGTRDELRKMGYVAHNGIRSIGAPEGPPSIEDFKSLGFPFGTPN